MKFINGSVYWHGTGRISNNLNSLLLEDVGCTPVIMLTILYGKVEIFPSFKESPPKIIPDFVTE